MVPSSATSYGSSSQVDVAVPEQFPVGLRVLVVDDDSSCLRILETMLRRCLYNVTTCSQATVALNLLRKKKGCFDVVMSDVHMPNVDGYKLLEHIRLEIDLPIIMISADERVTAVMKGIRYGACDYLIKPIREEELKNIWQHVIRRKWNRNKEIEHSGTKRVLKYQKKRICTKEEDDGKLGNEDPSTKKKPRIIWSVELHQKFVSAVDQLGIDKATAKRIRELMNVSGLKRESIGSHLQKFRKYLKRLNGVQGGISNTSHALVETDIKPSSLGRLDIQASTPSGQFSPQILAALQAKFLDHPLSDLVTAMKQPALIQSSLQEPKCIIAENEFGVWAPGSNIGCVNPQNSNMPIDILHQQQHQQQQSILSEPSHSINVQPSCFVVPSHSSANFSVGNNHTSINQNCSFNRSAIIDYNLLSNQSTKSLLNMGQIANGDIETTGILYGYAAPYSISPSPNDP